MFEESRRIQHLLVVIARNAYIRLLYQLYMTTYLSTFAALSKTITGLALTMILFLSACSGNGGDTTHDIKSHYRAINKDDTASLNIVLKEKTFYGQYEVNHHGLYKDSGDVNGIIKGDTLKGTFHYQQYRIEKWDRIPIALLRRQGKLIMGTGAMEIYMNMTFFTKNIPIDYQHPLFVFEQTASSSSKKP